MQPDPSFRRAPAAPGGRFRLLLSADFAVIACGCALIFAICLLLGRGRMLWEDEMLGWVLLHDPSWRHMLTSWQAGADGGGLTFYVTGRLWFAIFGDSAVSFRLYSATAFAAAFAVLWVALRRYFHCIPLAVSMGAVWFIGPLLAVHICEGRFYGLFFLGSSLVFLAVTRAAADTRAFTSRTALLLFLANALLVTSHLLGIVYSAALLASLAVADLLAQPRRFRPALYLSAASSWLLLLPGWRAIQATRNVTSPHFWTTRPTLHQLAGAYHAFSHHLTFALLLAFALLLLSWRAGLRALALVSRSGWHHRRSLYLPVLALALVPLCFALKSQWGTSIFVNRYLIPVTIVPLVFLAEMLRLTRVRRLVPAVRAGLFSGSPSVWFCGAALAALLLLCWNVRFVSRQIPLHLDYSSDLLSALPPSNLPVVLEDAPTFFELVGNRPSSSPSVQYLLDWQRSLEPGAPRADVSQFHLLSGWRRAGYYASSIQDEAAFLRRNRQFVVVETRSWGADSDPVRNTLLTSLSRMPDEQVELRGQVHTPRIDARIWLVCRQPSPACDAPPTAVRTR